MPSGCLPSRRLYFLDVDLKDGEWDGFRLGQELRRRDPHGTLVYITSYGDLAWRIFQYHLEAFDYIVKTPEETVLSVSRCLEAIHARLLAERRDPAEVFALRTGEMVRHVPLHDILFFETAPTPHHVLLHTASSRLDFLGNLKELENQLGDRFLIIRQDPLCRLFSYTGGLLCIVRFYWGGSVRYTVTFFYVGG